MSRFGTLCIAVAALSTLLPADDSKPIDIITDLTPIQKAADVAALKASVNLDNATISGVSGAGQLIRTLFGDVGQAIPAKGFSCIIHVVKWASRAPGASAAPLIAKSNWFVFNPQDTWTNADFSTNKRLFGVIKPYILMIHIGVPAETAPSDQYKLAYTYIATHRLPANVQDLKDAISLYMPAAPKISIAEASPPAYWALGTIEGNPPSDITITGAVVNQGTTVTFDSVTPKFDNEGFYRWDISIGVPILSYKTLQDVVSNSGQSTLANVDRRNSLVLANWFFKPVDVKQDTFLATPHLVGGVSLASKPLHTAVAGLGWGPVFANFYVGVLILTSNLPNHQVDHHYKLAFGLNVPLRTVASKLGLKTQVQ
jgi:hypothetical protein